MHMAFVVFYFVHEIVFALWLIFNTKSVLYLSMLMQYIARYFLLKKCTLTYHSTDLHKIIFGVFKLSHIKSCIGY